MEIYADSDTPAGTGLLGAFSSFVDGAGGQKGVGRDEHFTQLEKTLKDNIAARFYTSEKPGHPITELYKTEIAAATPSTGTISSADKDRIKKKYDDFRDAQKLAFQETRNKFFKEDKDILGRRFAGPRMTHRPLKPKFQALLKLLETLKNESIVEQDSHKGMTETKNRESLATMMMKELVNKPSLTAGGTSPQDSRFRSSENITSHDLKALSSLLADSALPDHLKPASDWENQFEQVLSDTVGTFSSGVAYTFKDMVFEDKRAKIEDAIRQKDTTGGNDIIEFEKKVKFHAQTHKHIILEPYGFFCSKDLIADKTLIEKKCMELRLQDLSNINSSRKTNEEKLESMKDILKHDYTKDLLLHSILAYRTHCLQLDELEVKINDPSYHTLSKSEQDDLTRNLDKLKTKRKHMAVAIIQTYTVVKDVEDKLQREFSFGRVIKKSAHMKLYHHQFKDINYVVDQLQSASKKKNIEESKEIFRSAYAYHIT
tara:strand:+ start:3 stop:1460 length:1458 start_codon:yes stop_codon:yes gene_type:complete